MTAMVASIQPHGFDGFSVEHREDDEVVSLGGVEASPITSALLSTTNDLGSGVVPVVDGVPCSYSLVDGVTTDDDGDDDEANTMKMNGDASTASSSTIPSLNDMEDDDDSLLMDTEDGLSAPTSKNASLSNKKSFGGLGNLGNTCYLNSALQMMASLDHFLDYLSQKTIQEPSKLRELLIQLLQKLERGETVRPIDMKRELDKRTPHFIGYQQQDSHEFLTTLMDLLDEDFKQKRNKNDINDRTMQDASSQEETNAESIMTRAQHDEGEEKSCSNKKQRLQERNDYLPSLPASGSFKDLQFADIESLLHGTASSPVTAPMKETMERSIPCKLAGGRMDTFGIAMTRLEDASVSNTNDNDDNDNTSITSAPKESARDASPETEVERNPINAYFQTQVRVCLTCDSCKYRRSHDETFLHLSLDIGPNLPTIEEGIRKFFAPEKRQLKCEKCFHETAQQTTEITRLPKALLLHLKRKIVDISPDYQTISYQKNQSPISFEETLSFDHDLCECLAPELAACPNYGIRSVVNHIGKSANRGHYTADSKRVCTGQAREWRRFNDSYVSKLSTQAALQNSSQTAYMILYEISDDKQQQ
jgi:ubiquitin C-terminal hydrolase